MLAKIITKKLNYRIIDCLADRRDTVTSIAKEVKSKKANVSKALRELEEENIATKEIAGRSHIYSFNCLHPEARRIMEFILINRANELNTRLGNLPKFVDAYLRSMLGNNYLGLIVFGSALTERYKDIDLFVIANELKDKSQIIENLKSISNKMSPIIATKEELIRGIASEDALYKNVINGVPFGCLEIVSTQRCGLFLLKRKDIEERFIIGYREIQSCKKFNDDKIYVKNHLEKGVFDIIYALLSYKWVKARNDREAEQLFKNIFKRKIPRTLKQAEVFAEKMKKVVFY